MAALRVLHLTGSAESAFFAELSLLYARDCVESVRDPRRYEVLHAHVTPDGRWRFPSGLSESAISAAAPMTFPAALAHTDALRPDVAVPQMFCRPGMTAYRAVLDLLGIAYLGNAPEVMALGADKARAKAVVAAAGVAVPAGDVLRRGDRTDRPLPVVVKPADADNSTGVSLVTEPGGLEAALAGAFAHGPDVLVEDFIPLGREVRCGVIDRGGELVVLPLEEYAVDPVTKPIRHRADKLAAGGSREPRLKLVAKDETHAWIVDPADPVTAVVGEAAKRCHRALGCRQYSLFDFRVDPAGRPWFLEASLYCSFARASVLCTMAAAAGIEVPELFSDVLGQALGGR
ncbi:D-alanine--D-alanine ligase [Amycolatopsis sp. PS_44_ISF1]|uniref:D-alanine--D-alanine ligase family protein n=1 Tax=Amycolatopsis sp. PS_44_ISF1 TaxID=2974917 RepID=UPI0028E07921|nr:D-alanine--D-alanine ligase [Amycolatopsis sp. PS_44_ISF1]MDT8914744.1 D-alanine--D-alanine ligase [Amycolatopsis sp. PS_44_ISF1]